MHDGPELRLVQARRRLAQVMTRRRQLRRRRARELPGQGTRVLEKSRNDDAPAADCARERRRRGSDGSINPRRRASRTRRSSAGVMHVTESLVLLRCLATSIQPAGPQNE